MEAHFLEGLAGRLEALLEPPEDDGPSAVALVCHPHPLFGGTMHNKVVYRAARALRNQGCAVLRFNFRGVGKSEGEHAGGTGEIEDARLALNWLRERYQGLPYLLSGFSFGSRVVLNLACALGDSLGVIALGFPAKLEAGGSLGQCGVPKTFIQSTHDEFGPRAEMEAYVALLPEPKRLVWVEARDHFFAGGLDVLETCVGEAAAGPLAGY